jgi:hypothetical protein
MPDGEPDSLWFRTLLAAKVQQLSYTILRSSCTAQPKKFANHNHIVALYAVWYNYVQLEKAVKMPPDMIASPSRIPWNITEIERLVEKHEHSLGA